MYRPAKTSDEPARVSIWRRVMPTSGGRSGVIVVLAAILMIVMMGMLAFSIDVGYMYTMQSQLQRSVDSATLAGAGALVDGEEASIETVHEYLVRNPVGTQWQIYNNEAIETDVEHFKTNYGSGLNVNIGQWDTATQQVIPNEHSPSTVGVSMTYRNMPFFFGHLLGRGHFDITAESVAAFQPRDIMLVLDLSGSMNDDSEFVSINILGRETVENNLNQIYGELGSPVYGNLQFEPQYAVVPGVAPQTSDQATVSVEYRFNQVYVTSNKTLKNVRLKLNNGNEVSYNPGGLTATLSPGREIRYVWVNSGKNGNNSDQVQTFNFESNQINNTIREALGLDDVAYPYPSGSWNEYINYVRSSSGQNNSAGYRHKYGAMNLVNFWLQNKPSNSQTPDLWKVSAQPITALKNSVDFFIHFLEEVDCDDRLGLSVYNAPNGNGLLESTLTRNFSFVKDQTNRKQASHYHNYTNIGAGMTTAREELDARGRPGALKMIVLMTDGVANYINGGVNQHAARNYVLSEAHLAAASGYPIVTISLGAGADVPLMEEVAEITKGATFNVPGGRPAEEYAEELAEVFKKIAKHRPLKLVK